ncbi:MAG: CPBP family intramembrane glutamic endopeptidase [Candidatus Thorarchaeota archaeon]
MEAEESFLSQRIIFAFIILEVLNWSFLLLGSYVNDLLALDVLTGFTFRFGIRAVQCLGIVPFILKVPNGKRSLGEYLADIKITNYKPTARLLIITIVSTCLLLAGLAVAGIAYGNFVLDTSIIFNEEAPLVLLAINAGLWEEITWRGIVLTLFLKRYSIRTSITINTILFALSHLINLFAGRDILIMIGQLIFVLIATPFLAYVFIKTESLLPSILIHYSIDAFGMLFYASMLQPGPNLIIGGIFMLVGWFVGNILAFGFLRIYLKDENSSIGEENENRNPD